ncbi:MAG: DUF2927 domain-containing protein, partial [Sedimentitalea sp.]
MITGRAAIRIGLALATVLALVACATAPPRASLTPQQRPAGLVAPPKPAQPSQASRDLARYYAGVQSDLLTRGLLRTDGGGPDTPYDADDLVENFVTLAFFEEYTRSAGVSVRGSNESGQLSRWSGPVRIGTEFGPSVSADIRARDATRINAFANRLARVTSHQISVANAANFHVFVASEDDSDFIQTRLKTLVPNISQSELDLFANLPRSFYCLVVAVSGTRNPHDYIRAIALIRAEHPDLVRLSCIHEEISQGLGLPNDSPAARPSIFNDDDEFALLTSHDEKLLSM